MSIKMSKGKLVLFVITIMLSNIAVMGEMVITPIINSLYETYFENITAVNLIISTPPLVMIIASLTAPFLLKKLSKKTMLIIGGILFAVSGSLGAAIDNVWYIFALRIPYGIGIAFVNVAAVAFIAEIFTDDAKRGSIMGFYNAIMAGIGAAMSFISGYLAVSDWKLSYHTYWSAIPMVILFILFLPAIKPGAEEPQGNDVAIEKVKQPFGKQFWILIAAFVLFNVVYSLQFMFISTYVAENALGDSALAGTLVGLGTIGSFLFCLIFGKVYSKIGKNVIIIYYTAVLIGTILLWLFPTLVMSYIVIFLCGGAYGSAFSYAYAHSPAIVPESKIVGAIGIVTASYSLGSFLTPYFVTLTMGILGSFTVTPVFGVAGILMAVVVLLEIVNARVAKN